MAYLICMIIVSLLAASSAGINLAAFIAAHGNGHLDWAWIFWCPNGFDVRPYMIVSIVCGIVVTIVSVATCVVAAKKLNKE